MVRATAERWPNPGLGALARRRVPVWGAARLPRGEAQVPGPGASGQTHARGGPGLPYLPAAPSPSPSALTEIRGRKCNFFSTQPFLRSSARTTG